MPLDLNQTVVNSAWWILAPEYEYPPENLRTSQLVHYRCWSYGVLFPRISYTTLLYTSPCTSHITNPHEYIMASNGFQVRRVALYSVLCPVLSLSLSYFQLLLYNQSCKADLPRCQDGTIRWPEPAMDGHQSIPYKTQSNASSRQI